MANQDSTGRSTRVACYARISTLNHQKDPELQLRELREYCQRRGWEITGEYVDCGISGSKERRPQLDRLLAACRKRQADAVVVYRYDRFARSLRQLVNALEEFRSLGIDFVSLSSREHSILARVCWSTSAMRSEKVLTRAGWEAAAMKNSSTQRLNFSEKTCSMSGAGASIGSMSDGCPAGKRGQHSCERLAPSPDHVLS